MDVNAVLRPIDDPGWSSFVANHRSALPFHHPAWAAMLADCYGFRAHCLCLDDPSGEIVAGLPVVEIRRRRGHTRWVSLPFTDHCPPLTAGTAGPGEAGAAGPGLAGRLDAARRAFGVRRFEVRSELDGARADGTFLTHRLPLTGSLDEVFATFHPNQVRRNIRRAERAGVTVRAGATEADLTTVFYRLHTRTRHRLGVPVQPRRYFRLLWQHVLRSGLGVVLIAELDGVPVASGVFLASASTCVYKYGASDERQWSARPNHLLFWEAIRWAAARGCATFDFGRTDHTDQGLREFKSRWGTEEGTLTYHVLADGPAGPGGAAGAARGGLPAPLRSIIRHSPRFVPRALGEVLYRYTA
ncbi:MAG TPA: GNAT family N-acetyltransferase [Pilimelia sp.]|nr:GNAT family N-acetyltransferase [Pilimelia sp.]